MKKLVLVAGLFIAFTANAQYRKDNRRNDKIEYHQDHRGFEGMRLSPSQQRQISALSKQRLSSREYDIRVRKILSRAQYAQYQKADYYKDKRLAENHGFRR